MLKQFFLFSRHRRIECRQVLYRWNVRLNPMNETKLVIRQTRSKGVTKSRIKCCIINDNEVKAMSWKYGAGNRLNTLEKRENESHVDTTWGGVDNQSGSKHSGDSRSRIKMKMTGRSKTSGLT